MCSTVQSCMKFVVLVWRGFNPHPKTSLFILNTRRVQRKPKCEIEGADEKLLVSCLLVMAELCWTARLGLDMHYTIWQFTSGNFLGCWRK